MTTDSTFFISHKILSARGLHSFTAERQEELAPIFFQASLLPYLLFLYFLSYRGNRIPNLANFGFQFLLIFVVGTVVAGVLAKTLFASTLANVDWLHGAAESLLTISNILIVIGFKDGMTIPNPSMLRGVIVALVFTAFLIAFMILGTTNGFQEHDHFLWGAGNLNSSVPWARREEPDNALSIPTWTIHLMSVIEYVVAMKLVWNFSEATNNSKWKGLTWGMLPMHASSICAVTHHFFYNNPDLLFLVTTQAFLTLLGNTTTMIAVFRIARSNGWTLLQRAPPSNEEAPLRLTNTDASTEGNTILLAKLTAFTIALSYAIKYGELSLVFPATPNAAIALSMIIGIPAITASYYIFLSIRSRHDQDDESHGDSDDSVYHDAVDEESPLLKK